MAAYIYVVLGMHVEIRLFFPAIQQSQLNFNCFLPYVKQIPGRGRTDGQS